MMAVDKIFIGGTGRSGTSILYSLLRAHPEVFAFEHEMRLLTDADGLLPLIESLSTDYTFERGQQAIYRFNKMLRYDLLTPKRSPYLEMYVKHYFGEGYERAVQEFIGEISHGSFEGYDIQQDAEENYFWTGEYTKLRRNKSFDRSYHDPKRYVPKYFSDRQELEAICSRFVDGLFSIPAQAHGKDIWCEKTPGNLFSINGLHALFPNALFIHIKRDPRGVCQSYMKQRWAPSELTTSAALLADMHKRWTEIRAELSADIRYVEIKLEDLVRRPDEILTLVAEAAGLSSTFPTMGQLDVDKADYWKKELTPQELQEMNELLSEMITDMGYEQ